MAEDLPSILQGVDVVVNPSLRAVSETFCIANIEAMAAGVPVVTFGVGGIGEYIDTSNIHPPENPVVVSPFFEVVVNAILVHEATGHALAEAVMFLMQNESVFEKLKENARNLVVAHFNPTRQMNQYAALYQTLADGVNLF